MYLSQHVAWNPAIQRSILPSKFDTFDMAVVWVMQVSTVALSSIYEARGLAFKFLLHVGTHHAGSAAS